MLDKKFVANRIFYNSIVVEFIGASHLDILRIKVTFHITNDYVTKIKYLLLNYMHWKIHDKFQIIIQTQISYLHF